MDSETILWNSDTTYALGYYRTAGRALGIWPLHAQGNSNRVRVAFATIMLLLLSFDLTRRFVINENCGTLINILDVVTTIICGILVSIKVLMPHIHQYSMYVIVNSAIKDWATVKDEDSRRIMFHFSYLGRVIFISQMIFANIIAFQTITSKFPLLVIIKSQQFGVNGSLYNLPMGFSCWTDDMAIYHYAAIYFLQSVQIIIECGAAATGDAISFGVAMHICGQYKILYQSLENLNEVGSGFIYPDDPKTSFYTFIQRHKHLLALSDHFEKIYSMTILAVIAANGILLCISGLALLITTQSGGDIATILGLVVRIYLLFVQLFLFSYVGERLSEQSKKLRDAIYNCQWYSLTPDTVRDLKFIIMKSSHPFHLTAGKILIMNIPNFMQMIKTMGSYFSVLRLMFRVD